MKSTQRGLAALVTAAAVLFSGALIAHADDGVVTDAALKACINTSLGQGATAPIAAADLAGLTTLTCTSQGVASLEGLEHATNLTTVNLSGNKITDFDELAGSAKLTSLNLDNNHLSALPDDMSGMESLATLLLHRDATTSPAAGISSLEPLEDVDTLGLVNIEFNKVTDLSPLVASADTLTAIYASSNPLASFEPVADLPNLVRLWASGPAGTTTALDLTPIDGLANLQQLYLNNRALTNESLEQITDLPKLNQLRLHDNHITDLSPIAEYLERTPFQLYANRQTVTLDDTLVNLDPAVVTVTNFDGTVLPLTTGAGAEVAEVGGVANGIVHTLAGTHTFTWSNQATQWGDNGRRFDGTITQTATKDAPLEQYGDLSDRCVARWVASADIDLQLTDPSNNGYGYLVDPKDYPESQGLFRLHHWTGNYGAGPLHWRVPVATDHAITNAKLVLTPGDNWDIVAASLTNQTHTQFLQFSSLDADDALRWPADAFITAPTPTVEDGLLVFTLGDLPAGTAFQVQFDGAITDGSQPTDGSVYSLQADLTGDFVRGDGPADCVPLPPKGTDYAWGDQSGDRIGDILAVGPDGVLTTHFGTIGGLSGAYAKAGGGWQNFTWISHTPDVNGDGIDDLLGLRKDGLMFMYYGQGMGQFGSARVVGTGWGNMHKIVVVGDMNADGSTEVAAVGANGNLYRYTMTTDGLKDARHIGKNWLGINQLTSVGDFNGDGTADILATNPAGDLLVYYSGNGGVIIQAAKVGRGWTGFTAMFAPGDLTGDARVDLVGRRADGSLFLYSNNGNGRWGVAKQIGTGWNGVTLFG
ncbi:leucine-rich repeat domain-containing protein [Aestuariimicrobium sp. Y1814]|uniref:leucine-rich repeat domain-containing protein n=1 Tax=Aestuariimicrobium sp. Y1814 TaxID=3418742 RepID=UPI003DA757B5